MSKVVRCQVGRDGPLVNVGLDTAPFWRRHDHCDEVATHRISAGCVHEHVMSWYACATCASLMETRFNRGDTRYCPRCPGHKCLVAATVRPLEAVHA